MRRQLRRKRWREEERLAILREARRQGPLLLFADEASFAQWGSLGYIWALRGQQPLVKTTGKRKGYKVMGSTTSEAAYSTATASCVSRPKANVSFWPRSWRTRMRRSSSFRMARYDTAAETQRFIAARAARLSGHQLPSYSPDYNPIEHLWRNVKRDKTRNRYFPAFEALIQAVDAGLTKFQHDPAAVSAGRALQ